MSKLDNFAPVGDMGRSEVNCKYLLRLSTPEKPLFLRCHCTALDNPAVSLNTRLDSPFLGCNMDLGSPDYPCRDLRFDPLALHTKFIVTPGLQFLMISQLVELKRGRY